MNTRPFSHGSDSSKYMYYLTIWTPRPFSHGSDSSKYMCYLTIWTTRPFSHGSDSSMYMYYLTIWTKKAVFPRKWLKWVHVLSYNMNKKGRSHTEVTQVSTCAILQYEQKRPFSHGSDSSEYMCYLTIWTKKAVLPTEVTQVSTCVILQYEQKRPFSPLKWLK